jgi:hypothetical protein
MSGQGLPPGGRVLSAWLSPALLLAVPAALIAEGRDGLWLALLFVVAPLFAFVALASARSSVHGTQDQTLETVAALLMIGLLVWANLSLAGDVAAWLGWPRWRGIFPVVGALGLSLWPRASRSWPWLVPAGLLALFLSAVAIVHSSPGDPILAWSQIASQPAFRFPADSPWVTRGRAVGSRRGSLALLFEEEHRVTPLDPGPLRVEVSDRGRLQVQEWTLDPGQSVTLRPGDRLQVTGASRLRFEAGKRVPGAPASGIAWADSSRSLRRVLLIRFLGLGLTLLGGALALARFGGPPRPGRAGPAVAGLVLLVVLGWMECWAIYAVRWAPEMFLGEGAAAAAGLVELPALVFRGNPWGPRLVGLTVVGLVLLFLAASVALREHVGQGEGEAAATLGSDLGLWSGMFAVTALAALWPVEPESLVLSALGLGASTLAPLVLFGSPAVWPRSTMWAMGAGLALFLGATVLGRLGVQAGPLAGAIVAYPALVAAPVAVLILRVASRAARP